MKNYKIHEVESTVPFEVNKKALNSHQQPDWDNEEEVITYLDDSRNLFSIKSVKRLSDDKVFTVGGKTKHGWVIDKFFFAEYEDEGVTKYELVAWNEEDGGGESIENI